MDRPLLVEAVSVEAIGRNEQLSGGGGGGSGHGADGHRRARDERVAGEDGTSPTPTDPSTVRLYSGGEWTDAPLYQRADLNETDKVTGPAIIVEPNATTVVDDGWQATVTTHGHLIVRRVRARSDVERVGTAVDPVMLEIFNNLFMSIAEQMGARLEATAQSVNIKERLDFSCALFDPDGNLIANAPHMPVHLGSMGSSVQEVIRRRGERMRPGDVYAVNDPYHGGTHL